jgi:tetratricopeptide (TPR) repeat protein
LGTQLITAEARRAEWVPNPDSLDLYFQGMACAAKGMTPEYLSQASGYFERALELDPDNIQALVRRAHVNIAMALATSDDQATQFAAAEAALTKALSLVPEHAVAHAVLGYVQILTNRAFQGIAECERALALDRNLATAHSLIGLAKSLSGRGEETEAHVQAALRLSPRDTNAYLWMGVAGFAKLLLGSDEEAVTQLRRALEFNRNHPRAYFWLAAALAHLDRLNEARSMVRAGLALTPITPCVDSATVPQATIRPIWRSASGSRQPCARPGYRKDDGRRLTSTQLLSLELERSCLLAPRVGERFHQYR